MKKNKKIIIALIIIQVLMTWLSISQDNEKGEFFNLDTILMPIFVGSWAYLLAIPSLLGIKNRFAQITNLGFYIVSIFNIVALARVTKMAFENDGLRETGLIFIAFPIVGFYITFGWLIVGSIGFYIKERLQRKSNT